MTVSVAPIAMTAPRRCAAAPDARPPLTARQPAYHRAIALSLLLPILLIAVHAIRWETNDDIAMSMIAHGYGLADHPSPNLVFSNVLWGHLVQLMPSVAGVPGYSIATLCLLLLISVILTHALMKAGVNGWLCFGILTLVMVRPLLFPQFTLVAGLLTASAIALWHRGATLDRKRLLLMAVMLGFLGLLIRAQAFFLVVLVALPFLPWKTLLSTRNAQYSVLLLVSAGCLATWMDASAYRTADWQAFRDYNAVRIPFTDYQLGAKLTQNHPERLAAAGYSRNDIALISNWFSIDRSIADPQRLVPLVTDHHIGVLSTPHDAITRGWLGIKALWDPALRPLLVLSIVLLLAFPNRKLVACWAICLLIFFMIGALGRPGVTRIYHPVLSFLTLAPLLLRKAPTHATAASLFNRVRLAGTASVAVVCAILATIAWSSHSHGLKRHDENVRASMAGFSPENVIIWGGSFPYESIYPVLTQAMSYRLYALGSFTLAPFSVSFVDDLHSPSMLERIQSPEGIGVLATPGRTDLLRTWCAEHLSGSLVETHVQHYGHLQVSWLRCAEAALPSM